MIVDVHPAILLLVGGLLLAVLPGRLRQFWMVALPVLSLVNVSGLEVGTKVNYEYMGLELLPLNAGKLNLLFVYLFHVAAILGSIYALQLKDRVQLVAGAMYAGSAVGVALSGDLLTLFIFWELLAVTSVFLIWARKSKSSGACGVRYLMMHIFSGLLLLAGAAFQYADTGSLTLTQLDLEGIGPWCIFLAIGIKCAFPFFHTWLVDSYPEGTPTGTVFLSAFTTKAAVCILAQTFVGTWIIIPIGATMAMFPIFYAVIENDLRKVLGYSMINQIGFMVVGIGIGTEMAVNGAVAHAFNDVIFKGLLFMSMGAVLYRTGKINGSELGGLYKSMPMTTVFCIIGAASISAFPLFSGFVSKSMVMTAVGMEGHTVVWLLLLFASAGVFHHAGIKIPFFAFFAHDSGIRCKEAPWNMLLAMGIAAGLCIFNGIFPTAWLYPHLPNPVEYEPYTVTHVITQTQILFFSALAFAGLMLLKIYPPELKSVNLDVDWFYRKGARAFYRPMDKSLNGINAYVADLVAVRGMARLGEFSRNAPAEILGSLLVPIWMLCRLKPDEIADRKEKLALRAKRGAFPVGITACLAVIMLAIVYLVALSE